MPALVDRTPPAAVEPPLAVSTVEAARLLDCSRSYIYKLIAEGAIRRTIKIGRSRRIPRSELERLVAEGT